MQQEVSSPLFNVHLRFSENRKNLPFTCQLYIYQYHPAVLSFHRKTWPALKHMQFRSRICKRLRNPGIDPKESIPPAYVARMAGRHDNPISTESLHRLF
jgi:hypothetical protein